MRDGGDWAAHIPHAGDMRLLDAVNEWSETSIHATALRHRADGHPLRSEGGLHAVHLAEYGAQAVAVHGAVLAISRGAPELRQGRLVSLRDVRLDVEYVDLSRGMLDVRAECLFADAHGAHYHFTVAQNDAPLAAGRVAVMYVSD
jgi:predicted hotdog family 3-hydroxylacyl-ACP dehydratase